MSCEKCGQAFCVCQVELQVRPHIRSTYIQQPLGITKEEFGVDLYEAIKAAAGAKQAFRTADVYRKKGLKGKAELATKQGKVLLQEVEGLLQKGTISEGDQQRITALL